MTNAIYCQMGNELDSYIGYMKNDYKLVGADIEKPITDILCNGGVDMVLYSFRALNYRLKNKIPVKFNVPAIAVVSEEDLLGEEDPIGILMLYGIAEIICEPVSEKIFLTRIKAAVKRTAAVNMTKLSYSHKLYETERFLAQTEYYLKKYTETRFEMICVDVERVKILNEMYGFEKVDKLIDFLDARLTGYINKFNGIVGRNDGDILMLLPSREHKAASRLPSVIDFWIKDYNFPAKICFNIGVYMIEDCTMSVQNIIDRAKIAANAVKSDCTAQVAQYSESIYDKFAGEQSMVSEMEQALENKDFVLYVQPQVNMLNHKIVGAEILVRWQHPEKGMINPQDFIPVYERNGFIKRLDLYIFREACRTMRRCIDEGIDVVPFSVNLSGISFYYEDFYDEITDILKEYGLDSKDIQLEITESAYVENIRSFKQTFERLKRFGFIIHMDDFGSGYSSLNSLKSYNMDIIKLDMAFLRGWNSKMQEIRAKKIVDSVIQMSRKLGIRVIVEGVETKEQVDFLIGIGCQYAQGFYFFKPYPMESFLEEVVGGKIGVDRCGIEKRIEDI